MEMKNMKTGWERNNRTHFDEIVVNYDRVRWNYPDELFAEIIKYTEKYTGTGSKKALEIGAGTGKATAPILNAGYSVTAVEMGANMSEFLLAKYKEYKNFNVVTAAFEDVKLEESSYDLIYAASAFHWVDAEIGCPKVFRLLKPGGTFALLRNNVYTADGDPLYEEIQAAYQKHYFSYYTSKQRWSRHSYDDLSEPPGILNGFGFEGLSAYGFGDIFMKFCEKTFTYSADAFVALMDTMSDHRELPEDNRAALYAGIKEAIIKHGGQFSQDSVFTLYMGRKP
jgi:SAM-dependent methyltransferase